MCGQLQPIWVSKREGKKRRKWMTKTCSQAGFSMRCSPLILARLVGNLGLAPGPSLLPLHSLAVALPRQRCPSPETQPALQRCAASTAHLHQPTSLALSPSPTPPRQRKVEPPLAQRLSECQGGSGLADGPCRERQGRKTRKTCLQPKCTQTLTATTAMLPAQEHGRRQAGLVGCQSD